MYEVRYHDTADMPFVKWTRVQAGNEADATEAARQRANLGDRWAVVEVLNVTGGCPGPWVVEIDGDVTVGSHLPMSEDEARAHYREVIDREHEMGLHGQIALLRDGVTVHETCSTCRARVIPESGACKCDGAVYGAVFGATG